MPNWYSDPCRLLETSEKQVTCPSCVRNKYSMQKNGFKRWYCDAGQDQMDGTRGQRNCEWFHHKGLAKREVR